MPHLESMQTLPYLSTPFLSPHCQYLSSSHHRFLLAVCPGHPPHLPVFAFGYFFNLLFMMWLYGMIILKPNQITLSCDIKLLSGFLLTWKIHPYFCVSYSSWSCFASLSLLPMISCCRRHLGDYTIECRLAEQTRLLQLGSYICQTCGGEDSALSHGSAGWWDDPG